VHSYPSFLKGTYRELLGIEDTRLRSRLKVYSRYTYGFNARSLRYAFITYLLRRGVSPSIIAKMIRHSRLDYILTYTQEKTAEEILRKIEWQLLNNHEHILSTIF
jgi:site-specific recombinase XerD